VDDIGLHNNIFFGNEKDVVPVDAKLFLLFCSGLPSSGLIFFLRILNSLYAEANLALEDKLHFLILAHHPIRHVAYWAKSES